MFKKVVSIALIALLAFSMAVIAVSAESLQVDLGAGNTEDIENVVTSTGANTISFDTKSANWKDFSCVYCHVWACDETGEWPSWQSKVEKCEYDESTGIATYDLSKTGNEIGSGANWACIFCNENGAQTYNLLFGSECFGDTAYCDGIVYENPSDSNRTTQAAFWKDQDKSEFGPQLAVTSIGNVVGTCCPDSTTPYAMMISFLKDTLNNARTYSGKTDQQIIDDIAAGLGLSVSDVEKAISESGVTVDWKKGAVEPSLGGAIHLDVKSLKWTNFEKIYCNVYSCDKTGTWPEYQSEAAECEYNPVNGCADYDLSKTGNVIGNGAKWYCVFSNNKGEKTAPLLLGRECFGDIAYPISHSSFVSYTGEKFEDLSYLRWRSMPNSNKFGPMVFVTDFGTIMGDIVPENVDPIDILTEAIEKNIKDDGFIYDKEYDIYLTFAKNNGLTKDDLDKVIKETGAEIKEWKSDIEEIIDKINDAKDANGSNETQNPTATESGGKSSSSNNSSTTNSAAVKTGSEQTAVILLVLLVLVSGAVFYFKRKKLG